jgi:hypothetical protein
MNRIVATSLELTVGEYRHDRNTEMETMVKHVAMWRVGGNLPAERKKTAALVKRNSREFPKSNSLTCPKTLVVILTKRL